MILVILYLGLHVHLLNRFPSAENFKILPSSFAVLLLAFYTRMKIVHESCNFLSSACN